MRTAGSEFSSMKLDQTRAARANFELGKPTTWQQVEGAAGVIEAAG